MLPKKLNSRPHVSQALLEAIIRAGLIAGLAAACFVVFQPFLNLLLWSLFLAVMLYPLHRRLRARLGNHDGRAATLVVVFCLIVLVGPTYLLSVSLIGSVQDTVAAIKGGSLLIPPPPDALMEWPRLYSFWQQAATDLSGMLHRLIPDARQFSLGLLRRIADIGVGFMILVGALIIAGIMMAFGEQGHYSMRRIAWRLVGTHKGDRIVTLCTATIRTVAQGVIGIAFIQMLLIGVGFVLMGIPGAGLLALVILILGLAQVPVSLITLPVIAYVFATEGVTVVTVVFALYSFLAGLVDNVLKPLLLGRGVDVPMPVVLIGALGGMVAGGIIGLFIGPIVLAVGYRLFWEWVDGQAGEELPNTSKQPDDN